MPSEFQDPPEVPPGAAELGEAVRAYQAAVDDFDREVARLFGVNETDLRCLELLLQDLPEASPGQLASNLGLTTGSVTPMLDRLERLGYLTRSPHPTDRRKTIVRATPEAGRRAGELIGPLVADSGGLLSHYTEKDLELLVDFMHRARELQQRHVERLRATATQPPDRRPP
jgi:DNA-binding MarR family transcriptional regulator